MELFEKARDLELAASEEKLEYVRTHHEEVMKIYRELVEVL